MERLSFTDRTHDRPKHIVANLTRQAKDNYFWVIFRMHESDGELEARTTIIRINDDPGPTVLGDVRKRLAVRGIGIVLA